ncbi:MAG TPA: MMPL family transporter [Candidatus Limnocylindrales bacterium]|nr:MMPL family transporter [Candidatus Limnocylindrales bacterium]
MFSRWGAFVYRRRRIVLLVMLLLAAGGAPLASGAADQLSAGGWLDPKSESAAVADRLEAEFGGGRTSFVALFRSDEPVADARSAEFQAAIAATVEPLRDDGRVSAITGFAETGDERFISVAGDATYVVIGLDMTDEESVEVVDEIEAQLEPPSGYSVALTGFGPIQKDSAELSEKDLQRAEMVSLPIAALVLILVFASIVAAGMPLLVAGLAIPSSLAIINLLARQTEMSIYVLNIATMLGLALAIDYSLFLTSRFREELAKGRSVEQAVTIAVGTAGKAVLFSGVAVAIGLSGLLWFEASALSSIGLSGAIVVLCSVVFSLTFLPALLGMLGPRVNALSVRSILRRVGIMGDEPTVRHSRWEQVAHAVMRRPIAVLLPVLVLLFIAGSPFFRLQQGVPDATVYPAGVPSRDAWVALLDEFRPGETTPITIILDTTADATDPASVRAVMAYAASLEAVDGIDRVEGPFTIADPATGAQLTPDQVAQLYAAPPGTLPPELEAAVAALEEAYIRGSTVRLDAISPLRPTTPEGTAVVPDVRDVEPGDGIESARVGGTAAVAEDFLVAQNDRMPWAIGTTLLASAVILFLLFGSIAIPLKAVVMTLLSLSASFGALVWVFQEGNLHELLGFEPIGFTIAGNPIIMFATLIGLSMDYEVLLLSRIQEAYRRTKDNTAAVAEGLAKTAGVITGAAMIMVVVFSAFALADVVTIKSIGVGMALAVLLDATVVRVLLVPATMRLLGEWNWWAPGILGRLADRLGFSHVEDDGDGSDAAEVADAAVTPA